MKPWAQATATLPMSPSVSSSSQATDSRSRRGHRWQNSFRKGTLFIRGVGKHEYIESFNCFHPQMWSSNGRLIQHTTASGTHCGHRGHSGPELGKVSFISRQKSAFGGRTSHAKPQTLTFGVAPSFSISWIRPCSIKAALHPTKL